MKCNFNQLFLVLLFILFFIFLFINLQYQAQNQIENFNLTAAFIDLATYGGIDSYLYN